MNRPVGTKPQLALQSYLDGLLQDATEAEDLLDLPGPAEAPAVADEFAAAVREEQ
ncbi:MAG TPA: chemotaxis protein CheW, partial [Pseudomonas sp.]|nr:chemotaxis protein CheW [Pseudomonas sp.]